jgi:hypothetical protein
MHSKKRLVKTAQPGDALRGTLHRSRFSLSSERRAFGSLLDITRVLRPWPSDSIEQRNVGSGLYGGVPTIVEP